MLEIGTSLREARRRRKLELATVERATRIRVQQLEALEQERFEQLPPDPYRRSFLREYADFLGLDSDLYTTEYDRRFRPPETPVPSPPARRHETRSRLLSGKLGLLLAGLLAIVALAAVGAWQLSRPGGSGGHLGTSATLGHGRPRTASPAHHHAGRAGPARKAARTLVLTATRGSCWVWVRLGSSAGPTIYRGTLPAGKSLRFGLNRPLWVRLGAPWNLDAAIGTRSLTEALPGYPANVLATAAGLRSAP